MARETTISLKTVRIGRNDPQQADDYAPAPRQRTTYSCPTGHEFEVPLATDADVPDVWECPRHSIPARSPRSRSSTPAATKRPRTHWDMLLERRTRPELEALLQERLDMLRAQRTTNAAHQS
ncbi:RNA polymerase-binding protein RbpA [Saccharopolyspora rosea]|uniref:RNA polymerase-binding protein RbpA n=1 Tax=Saccharopolyspora rosea TaxID=524884 RepID=UPI0021D92C9D|nr:RNA polymerase-binding protein RbpA [Saccharopolyspora rosea]